MPFDGLMEDGYRLFDTASYYGNEELVGACLAALDADRESYFVTTKIWNDEQASGDIEGSSGSVSEKAETGLCRPVHDPLASESPIMKKPGRKCSVCRRKARSKT